MAHSTTQIFPIFRKIRKKFFWSILNAKDGHTVKLSKIGAKKFRTKIWPKIFFTQSYSTWECTIIEEKSWKIWKKFSILSKNMRFQTANFWTGGRKKFLTKILMQFGYPTISIPSSNCKKNDKKISKKILCYGCTGYFIFKIWYFWWPQHQVSCHASRFYGTKIFIQLPFQQAVTMLLACLVIINSD